MPGRLTGLIVTACVMGAACASSGVPTTLGPTTTVSGGPPSGTISTTSTALVTTTALAPPPVTTEPDTTPPELSVTYPVDGQTVFEEAIEVRGTGEPGSDVSFGDATGTRVNTDGSWVLAATLAWGDNTLRIQSQDEAGNEAVEVVLVRYTPPMPCPLHVVDVEHQSNFPVGPVDWCGGWGYVESVDVVDREIVFDLAQVTLTVPGDESEGWTIVNANPRTRVLPVSASVEVRACAPEPGETVPSGGCGESWVGNPWGFALWSIGDLEGFVNAGHDFWKVLVDPASGEVVWVEQWWSP